MAGLVPAIHDLLTMVNREKDVDARDKRGHDERGHDESNIERIYRSQLSRRRFPW
jgi:hypothetical protein